MTRHVNRHLWLYMLRIQTNSFRALHFGRANALVSSFIYILCLFRIAAFYDTHFGKCRTKTDSPWMVCTDKQGMNSRVILSLFFMLFDILLFRWSSCFSSARTADNNYGLLSLRHLSVHSVMAMAVHVSAYSSANLSNDLLKRK